MEIYLALVETYDVLKDICAFLGIGLSVWVVDMNRGFSFSLIATKTYEGVNERGDGVQWSWISKGSSHNKDHKSYNFFHPKL